MRKWREIHSLDFLIFSLFPPFLSISYIKNCNILSQNVKDRLLSRMSQKTYHTYYEKIILGRIRCEKAPQFGRACINTNNAKNIGLLNNTIQLQQHQIENGEAGVKSDRAKTTLGELLSNPN